MSSRVVHAAVAGPLALTPEPRWRNSRAQPRARAKRETWTHTRPSAVSSDRKSAWAADDAWEEAWQETPPKVDADPDRRAWSVEELDAMLGLEDEVDSAQEPQMTEDEAEAVLVEELGAEEVERLKWEQLKADAQEVVTDEEGEQALGFQLAEDDDDEWDDDEQGEEIKTRSIPSEMRYFDTAKICIKAGDGGDGVVAFRREKHVPYGGPAGGNGGDGGNIIVRCAGASLSSLKHFRTSVHFRAKRGDHGGGAKKEGSCGQDTIVEVPVGTVVRMMETREMLCEMLEVGQSYVLMQGGRGGRGNTAFKRGLNRAPTMSEVGERVEERWLELEMKLVADVGIVGVPNAGKSTLLAALSNAKPKIADYPFTTLVPNLGVYEEEYLSVVIADIPGILEGAHLGVGLGQEFLRHCERTRVLIHLLDGASPDPMGDYDAINTELMLFNDALYDKPQMVVVNKRDLPDAQAAWPELEAEFQRRGIPVKFVSGFTGEGTREMMKVVQKVLEVVPEMEPLNEPSANLMTSTHKKKKRYKEDFSDFSIELGDDGLYFLRGQAIERFAQMTNWDYYESITRFQRVLKASGAGEALEAKGIKPGDLVVIGKCQLEWSSQTDSDLMEGWQKAGGSAVGSRHWPMAGRLGA